MKIVYAIAAILLVAFIEVFFELHEYTTVPFVLFIAGVFGADFFNMRKKGNTATFVLLVLFFAFYTYMIFFQFSNFILFVSSALGSMLGLSIGAVNLNNSPEEEMA